MILTARIQQFWNAELSRTIYATVAAHSNLISVGIIQGFSAIMLPQLKVSDDQSSWIAGLGVISTPIGAVATGMLVDYLGRRGGLFLPNFFFFISWMMIGFASDHDDDMYLLYLGRALGGLAMGMSTSSYLYVCEIAQVKHRGILSAFGPVFTSLGVLVVYTLGFFFDWRKTAFSASLISIISVILIYTVPDSPTWYASKNQPENARKSLQWLGRDVKTIDRDLQTLQAEFTHEPSQTETNYLKTIAKRLKIMGNNFAQPDVYKPFLILIAFFFFQEGSGLYIFLFYAVQIFKEFGTSYDENVVTITIGLLRLLMSLLGAYLIGKFGRRQLSIFSGMSMSLAMLAVSVYLALVPFIDHPIHIIPVLCVFFHVGASMVGFQQIPFILSNELFPARCRGLMSGITCSIAYVLIFLSVKLYPSLLAVILIQGMLWSFFCITAVGVVFLYKYLPETKDKPFAEISGNFLGPVKSLA